MNEDLYRGVLDFAHGTPGWVHTLVEYGTDGGVLVLLTLLVLAWWRARSGDGRAMALALLAPAATAVAYACSEVSKSVIGKERPCRAVTDAAVSIAPCPEVGDWSFPSNHSTIAAAAAVGLVIVWRRTAAFALPLAAAMAASRVFLGVHYPLDVSAGVLLGTVVAVAVAAFGVRPVTTLVVWLRAGALAPLLSAPGQGGGPAEPPLPGQTGRPDWPGQPQEASPRYGEPAHEAPVSAQHRRAGSPARGRHRLR